MEDNELLNEVKKRMLITHDFHDDFIAGLIVDAKDYMLSAGVRPRVLNGPSAIGCIARGVRDLWNMGAGDGKFSSYFYQRVIQLSTPMSDVEDGSEEFDEITEDEIDDLFGKDSVVNQPDYEITTKEEIDEIIEDVETPEYTTPDDIDDIISGDYNEPENPEETPGPDDEYEYITKDEIDDLFGEESSAPETEDEYEYVTKDDVDDLFK